MDFSIKNIKANKQLNFEGIKSLNDSKNAQIFRFFAPPYDKQKEKVFLEIVPLKEDSELRGEYIEPSDKLLKKRSVEFGIDDIVDLPQDGFKKIPSRAFAYRYRIEDKKGNLKRYVVDQAKTIKVSGEENQKANVINMGSNYGITPKGGAMYHVYKDSFGIVDGDKLKESSKNADFVRNHFNKLGGSTKGILMALETTNVLEPYRYIMSTPDIGFDRTSSHGYWPNNLYQCADIDEFKKLNFELFKRGKGYIADGAFTSQSLQSPLLHHVLKWGEDSPFFNMLKIQKNPRLGILPDKGEDSKEAYKNIGVRLINSPRDNYNPHKPTYFQFYDKRFVSNEWIRDNQNKILDPTDYDRQPKNHYEVTSNDDSVYPFYFEIDPNSFYIKKHFDENGTASVEELEKIGFFQFENYEIVQRDHAGNYTPWAGNRDIMKLNLSNPDCSNPKNVEGMNNARKYLYGVANFWTEGVQSYLILETAKSTGETNKKTAENNGVRLEDVKFSNSQILQQDKQIMDFILDFPLQSIETSPEMSAIFAQPSFNEELFLTHQTAKTIENIVNNVLDEAIAQSPARDKDEAYKKEYKTYLVKFYSNDIIKNILAGSFVADVINNDGTINKKALAEVNYETFVSSTVKTVDEERRQVIRHIQKCISSKNTDSIKNKIKKEIKNIDLEKFKQAEALVLQARGGLNWRFDAAKDIGDLDEVGANNAAFNPVWGGVEEFWTNFIGQVRQNNPSSYVISEITDMWSFRNSGDENYDSDMAKANKKLYSDKTPHERELPRLKEARFLENTGSTTSSNYEACFNNLSFFVGSYPEQGFTSINDVRKYRVGNLGGLKWSVDNQFLRNQQPHIAQLSHTFTDNHDKPRILHVDPLDIDIFYAKKCEDLNDEQKTKIKKVVGNDLTFVHPTGAAVAIAMNDLIEKSAFDESAKTSLKFALKDLAQGKLKRNDAKGNLKKSRAFGVTSYEVSIKDLFARAKEYGLPNDIADNSDNWLSFHYSLLKDGLRRQTALWEIMNAISGVPTIFNGTEFAQTGYETPSHNEYVQNRDRIRIELRNEEKYGYGKFFQKMSAITSMYQTPEFAALRSGTPISCDINNADSNENENWPIVKYDENGSKVVSIISSNGLKNKKLASEADYEFKEYKLKSIPLKVDKENQALPDGTILKKLVYDKNKAGYIPSDEEYVVKNGEIVNKDIKQNITMDDTVVTFYCPMKSGQIAFTSKALYSPHSHLGAR